MSHAGASSLPAPTRCDMVRNGTRALDLGPEHDDARIRDVFAPALRRAARCSDPIPCTESMHGTSTVADKVVVITGASSGIGESTARLLAQFGAKVVLGAR